MGKKAGKPKKAAGKPQARLRSDQVAGADPEVVATAKWLLEHNLEQRARLRVRLARGDRTIPFRDAHILRQALALIIEPKDPPRPGKPPRFIAQRVTSVVSGGAPSLGKR